MMSNISVEIAALGDVLSITGIIYIQIPKRTTRLARAGEVLVELWRNIGDGPDILKGRCDTDDIGRWWIPAGSGVDPNYLPCGPGHNYYIRATHKDSEATVRQNFVLNTGLQVTGIQALYLEKEGNTLPAAYS